VADSDLSDVPAKPERTWLLADSVNKNLDSLRRSPSAGRPTRMAPKTSQEAVGRTLPGESSSRLQATREVKWSTALVRCRGDGKQLSGRQHHLDLGCGGQCSGPKWDFKYNHSECGETVYCKARDLAVGYSHRCGLDYGETYLCSSG